MLLSVLASLFVILLIVTLNKLRCQPIDTRSPPQVPGSLPFFGHLLYLGGQPEKVLTKWGRIYGKLFGVNLGPLK